MAIRIKVYSRPQLPRRNNVCNASPPEIAFTRSNFHGVIRIDKIDETVQNGGRAAKAKPRNWRAAIAQSLATTSIGDHNEKKVSQPVVKI